ncbi:hypothetical protein POTOM_052574 [Populus tomentosa]|uniref:ABC transporter domain-containing protein n=1 Tax=Populus tomentosa TaxID=118781 RepID=A0A8X8C0F2_POPTO|nr:hypothetical protein POTOM_052574 [Populus tomentosa]
MCSVWENLTVELPSMITSGSTRKLLSDHSGYAEPGHIMAIMGPSGSGKSTLLDSLAGLIRETITYSAHLRLPRKTTKEELDSVVDNTIMEMGLL